MEHRTIAHCSDGNDPWLRVLDLESANFGLAIRKLDRIAPGYCTGEPAFAKFKQVFGESYLYAGLGSALEIR
jgi:hypothetical protein